ncbi:MarR family winged helix-turn-helix transcriptional regulator [Clostridium cellulovorans]|uniref:HTH marR-type domain-containing protein n=1 Tax=Clostridium cellulovorans (strain ATCC 35296 / DSM 3052 / OCM 3 / 743B) TaxID=573061 RepID=D9SU91_CLOC7|nr:MarR family winged helix-turn-helix transcriptional regulator [Clostridium cellulovorans]ADL52846.1 hypothetical protein Clocel_3160 [Clostridium cellulovorans 743B]
MDEINTRELIGQFNDSWNSILKLYEQYAKSVELSYVSFSVLEIIYWTPENCTQKLICQQTYLPKQTVNTVISDFWKRGIVELKEIAVDRRNKTIQLTESGQKYAKGIMERVVKAEEAAFKKMPPEIMQLTIDMIKDYADTFKEHITINESLDDSQFKS